MPNYYNCNLVDLHKIRSAVDDKEQCCAFGQNECFTLSHLIADVHRMHGKNCP